MGHLCDSARRRFFTMARASTMSGLRHVGRGEHAQVGKGKRGSRFRNLASSVHWEVDIAVFLMRGMCHVAGTSS